MTVRTKSILAGLVTYPLLVGLLFVPAGTVRWVAGWTFAVFFCGACLLLTRWLLIHDPALLEERMRVGRNQKGWDKFFLAAINVMFLAWWVIMPLDAVRFGWTRVPVALQAVGVAVTAASFRLFFLVFRANPFLSGVVRIQAERGHKVISTGPYRHVRHPMYAAALLLFVGVPLWLGSWCGVGAGLAFALLMAVRAVLEERTLAAELDGYDDYRRKVRYRLVPHVW